MEKTECFPLRSGKVRISAPTTITQHSEILDNEISLGKEITGIQIGKEEINHSYL